MTKIRRKVLTVTGSGLFPIDMLRYDHAWPRTEEDSYKISADYRDETNPPTMRTVELLTDHDRVTYDRWASFTWKVAQVRFT